jgi:hypothetical protein
MQVCQRWYNCWKDCWKIFAGRSYTASLVEATISSADRNRLPRSFSFKQGKERTRMVRDQVSMDSVAKRWPVVLAAPLGQAKPLCHLNTALRPKASPYACLIMWNVSLADLPNFWQNLTSPFAQTAIFSISNIRRQLPFRTVTFFLNTQHACNCFLLGREQKGHGTISWLTYPL